VDLRRRREAWCERVRRGEVVHLGAEIYAENAPAEDGRVYCVECGYEFPGLARFIERYRDPDPERRLRRYPRYCSECRPAVAAREATEREAAAPSTRPSASWTGRSAPTPS
jgi:hypothetical protein